MRIEELLPGQKVSLQVGVNENTLNFDTTVLEAYPKKRFILLAPIMHDDKAISFKGKGIIVNLVVSIEERPHLFRNVTIALQKMPDGKLCYSVTTLAESIIYNRRGNFRCYVGLRSSVQFGPNRSAQPALIRDVSYSGFAIVCEDDIVIEPNRMVHVVLRDRIEEIEENYIFHLYGIVKRVQDLNNGNILYGCKLNDRVPGLDQYIMAKERIRLRKTNGGNL